MIPKIIHYCWFGKNKMPKSAIKCIKSWHKFFPDYEIRKWTEDNFDVNCCNYVKEAYQSKKWAFVSDYARFWILYFYGGIYFDTDVEVIKDMSPIISNGAFMGCEKNDKYTSSFGLSLGAAPGLGLGAVPGLNLYKEILNYYESIHFITKNSSQIETVVDYTTKIIQSHGWKGNHKIEKVEEIYVYPPEYFCPMDYRTGKLCITENTYSIHWYTASWQSKYNKFKTLLQHLLGKDITKLIKNIKSMVSK